METQRRTREIPSTEWQEFFDTVSRRYLARRVTVQLMAPGIGVYTAARNLPLVGITAARNEPGTLEVMLGDAKSAHVMHSIDRPVRVQELLITRGEDNAIEIESPAGPTVLITFLEPQAKGAVK